jgi:hypothetical protein
MVPARGGTMISIEGQHNDQVEHAGIDGSGAVAAWEERRFRDSLLARFDRNKMMRLSLYASDAIMNRAIDEAQAAPPAHPRGSRAARIQEFDLTLEVRAVVYAETLQEAIDELTQDLRHHGGHRTLPHGMARIWRAAPRAYRCFGNTPEARAWVERLLASLPGRSRSRS